MISGRFELTAEQLFALSPIAQTIVPYLGPDDFMTCLNVCNAWNWDLDQYFLWKRAFFQAKNILVKTCFSSSMECMLSEQEEQKQTLKIAELKLIVCLVGSFQRYRRCHDLQSYQSYEDYALWILLQCPTFVYEIAGANHDLNFFKFHLRLIEEVELETLQKPFSHFFKDCMIEALVAAGNNKIWWIVEEFIQNLPIEALFRFQPWAHTTTILYQAATWGNAEIFQLLLDKSPNDCIRLEKNLFHASFRKTCLHVAVEKGHFEIVKMLIKTLPKHLLKYQNCTIGLRK